MAGKRRPKAAPQQGVLAQRIRERWGGEGEELALERLEAEIGESGRYDIVAALKELQTAGLGELRVGRHGQKPSFVWRTAAAARPSSVEQGRAATGARRSAPRAEPPTSPPREGEPPSSEQDVLEHSFHVRPHVLATFRLPADVTRQEIERLCQLLQAIPFR